MKPGVSIVSVSYETIAIRQRRGKFPRWVSSSHRCKAVCCPIPTCEPCEAGPKSSSEGSDNKGAGEADDMLSDN